MQPARYHSARDEVLAGVDEEMAEPLRLSFMKNATLDPDRPQIEIEAILRVGSGEVTSVSGGRDRDWRSRIAAQKAELHIDQVKYPTIVARKGDKVRALSRQGQPAFEVLAVDDRSMTRYVLQLGEA